MQLRVRPAERQGTVGVTKGFARPVEEPEYLGDIVQCPNTPAAVTAALDDIKGLLLVVQCLLVLSLFGQRNGEGVQTVDNADLVVDSAIRGQALPGVVGAFCEQLQFAV